MHNTSGEALVRVPESEKDKLSLQQESDFLEFIRSIASEVAQFNESSELGLTYEVTTPQSIDGDKQKAADTGFIISRRTGIFPQRTFCIYSLFMGQSMHVYLGSSEHGRIETHCELEPLDNFQEGAGAVYDWLRELVRMSSEDF